MSSIVEPASTGGINLTMPTMETSIIAAAVGAKRRKQTKVTQIQVIILILGAVHKLKDGGRWLE